MFGGSGISEEPLQSANIVDMILFFPSRRHVVNHLSQHVSGVSPLDRGHNRQDGRRAGMVRAAHCCGHYASLWSLAALASLLASSSRLPSKSTSNLINSNSPPRILRSISQPQADASLRTTHRITTSP